MQTPVPFFQRLYQHQRGAVAPFFLISTLLVLATSLGGIDLMRYSIAQGRLQYALDGATLSAGRNLANLSATPTVAEIGTWQEDAYAYFRSNMPDSYLGSTITPDDLHISYDEELTNDYVTGQFINMQASGDLPLLTTGFLKISSMPLHAANQALRRTRSDLELVMALDNTGSMAGTRLSTLKSAATELSQTVLGASLASGVEGRVFVGLVPFAETVNVGSTSYTRKWLETWADNQNDRQRFVTERWMGCITEPYWTPSTDGKLPARAWLPTSAFQPMTIVPHTTLTRDNLNLSARSRNYERPIASTPSNPQPRRLDTSHWEIKGVSEPFNTNSTSTSSTTEYFYIYSWANPNHCKADRKVLFLTDNGKAIDDSIKAMDADGGTIIPTGLLWAWRMLHPDWRGVKLGWGDSDKPRDPEPKILSKVIVLLTDGDNDATMPNKYSSVPPHVNNRRLSTFTLTYDVQRCTSSNFRSNCITAEKTSTISNKSVDTANRSYQHPINSLRVRNPDDTSTTTPKTTIGYGYDHIEPDAMDGYLRDLCYAVKNDGNGIKIYTVTLGQLKPTTNDLMKECSSGAAYAYNADNVSDLPVVFKAIAGALTELRLTQ